MLPLVSATKAFQDRVSTTIGELAIDYHDSPIVVDRDSSSRPRAGERAPGARVTRESGEPMRLYELLRDGKFVLLAFPEAEEQGGDFLQQVAASLAPIRSQIVPCVLTIKETKPANMPADWTCLHDAQGDAVAAYGVKHACVRVIRPDGYIGFRSNAHALESGLKEFIEANFGTQR